jgi:hypothetical protein
MNWMNQATTVQNQNCKRLKSNMRHCCPTFCTGDTKVGANSNIWLLDDRNHCQFWFSRRISHIVDADFGLIPGITSIVIP